MKKSKILAPFSLVGLTGLVSSCCLVSCNKPTVDVVSISFKTPVIEKVVYEVGERFDDLREGKTRIPEIDAEFSDGSHETLFYGDKNLSFTGFDSSVETESEEITVKYKNVKDTLKYAVQIVPHYAPIVEITGPQEVECPNGAEIKVTKIEGVDEEDCDFKWQYTNDLSPTIRTHWYDVTATSSDKKELKIANTKIHTKGMCYRCVVTTKWGGQTISEPTKISITNSEEIIHDAFFVGDYILRDGDTLNLEETETWDGEKYGTGTITLESIKDKDNPAFNIIFDNVTFNMPKHFVGQINNFDFGVFGWVDGAKKNDQVNFIFKGINTFNDKRDTETCVLLNAIFGGDRDEDDDDFVPPVVKFTHDSSNPGTDKLIINHTVSNAIHSTAQVVVDIDTEIKPNSDEKDDRTHGAGIAASSIKIAEGTTFKYTGDNYPALVNDQVTTSKWYGDEEGSIIFEPESETICDFTPINANHGSACICAYYKLINNNAEVSVDVTMDGNQFDMDECFMNMAAFATRNNPSQTPGPSDTYLNGGNITITCNAINTDERPYHKFLLQGGWGFVGGTLHTALYNDTTQPIINITFNSEYFEDCVGVQFQNVFMNDTKLNIDIKNWSGACGFFVTRMFPGKVCVTEINNPQFEINIDVESPAMHGAGIAGMEIYHVWDEDEKEFYDRFETNFDSSDQYIKIKLTSSKYPENLGWAGALKFIISESIEEDRPVWTEGYQPLTKPEESEFAVEGLTTYDINLCGSPNPQAHGTYLITESFYTPNDPNHYLMNELKLIQKQA